MFTSFSTALSALNATSTAVDVVGNNLANLNTSGFKRDMAVVEALTSLQLARANRRVLELAQAAVAAQTPLWVIGKAYGESDDYAQRFLEIARHHPTLVRYRNPGASGGYVRRLTAGRLERTLARRRAMRRLRRGATRTPHGL